ncbi:TlpA family protein disulfide reductase [Chitinophaga filiformis]|uniref:peroxiredoxin family protein n=1 Tax=Chitinophaga filiformis TaxID=104663 RepID=UPI001F3AAAAD|nr:TlpA disulfide reductase family protein [Chitinophaga filiformis]MCF6404112.1 TlpA family protein disulfide reductase [Chitinophaga filiformis]
MIKRQLVTACCLICTLATTAQQKQMPLQRGQWKASLVRNDGKQIPFGLEIQYDRQQLVAYIVNGEEKIRTENVSFTGDSAIMSMPVFESYFRIRKVGTDSLNGVWVKGTEGGEVILPFFAHLANRPATPAKAKGNIQGRWAMEITRPNQTKRPAVGDFTQKGNKVSGSIITPSADYRYLEGSIYGDSILFSTFDGSHAMLFLARIEGDNMTGTFYNGARGKEDWVAARDEHATLPQPASPVTAVKNTAGEKLNFSFRNIDGETVSINDERYKGKVVILQIMGSWCPNCMDETAFLSDYYRKNKDRGIEIIALAYELSTDENRSANSLRKFRQQFNVPYQMLITGVRASDPEKAEKTLPQLTSLKNFPTTIFVDREGKVSAIETNFYGPASKEYHEKFKREFDETVNKLLAN